jgi:hypothetical protein
MNQRQEMFVDDKFLVTYQNPRTGREHSVIVTKCDLMRSIEWHRGRGNMVNYLPISLVNDTPV